MTDTLFADVSYYQSPVDDSYQYPVLSIRSNDGTYRDTAFAGNHAWCKRSVDSGKLEFFIVYLVYRSNWQQTLDTLKAQVGTPHSRMVVMVDVESWQGRITGDHSANINALCAGIGDWLGNRARVIGYGNVSDLNSLWRTKPAGMRLVVAGYGGKPPSNYPGFIAHQYTNGEGYGGLPQGAGPWRKCDMNAANGLGAKQFAAACGLSAQGGVTPSAKPAGLVGGAIGALYDKLGGAKGFLGQPQTPEMTCPDGIGRYNHFDGGSIYWTPDTDAHEVHGAIRDAWAAQGWETGPLGYPMTDECGCDFGAHQNFQGGALYWDANRNTVTKVA